MSPNQHAPILIAAPARHGTTMLAWLLHLHGVWIGEAAVTARPETNPQVGTENLKIKHYLREPNPDTFRADILELVETDGPWLVKTMMNLIRRDLWLRDFPGAVWLFPWRPAADAIASAERTGRNVETFKGHIAFARQAQLEIIESGARTLRINMNNLVERRASEASLAVGFCGLTFDDTIATNWIDPTRWHSAEDSDGQEDGSGAA